MNRKRTGIETGAIRAPGCGWQEFPADGIGRHSQKITSTSILPQRYHRWNIGAVNGGSIQPMSV